MTFVEKRLNQSILRTKILKELNFLLEIGMEPGERSAKAGEELYKSGYVDKVIDQTKLVALASAFALNDFVKFANEISNLKPQEVTKILQLIGKDIIWIFKNDPVSAITFLLDVISVFDPTGLADLTQGIILLHEGNYVGAGLCLVFGAIQLKDAVATLATEGVTIPKVLATKAEVLTLKASIRFGGRRVADDLIRYILDPKMLNIVTRLKSSPIGEFQYAGKHLEEIIRETSLISRNRSPFNIDDSEKVLNQIFAKHGGNWYQGLKEIDSARVKVLRQQINDVLIKNNPPSLIGQALGLVGSTAGSVSAEGGPEEMRQKQRAEEYLRRHWCKIDQETEELCNDILTTQKYEHRSKSTNSSNLNIYKLKFNKILDLIKSEQGPELPTPKDRSSPTNGTGKTGGPPADATPIKRPPPDES